MTFSPDAKQSTLVEVRTDLSMKALHMASTNLSDDRRIKHPTGKACVGCQMAEENVLSDKAFLDWHLLGHNTKKLPIDREGIDAVRNLMESNQNTKILFDQIAIMLEKASDPENEDDLHQAYVELKTSEFSLSKEAVKEIRKRTGVNVKAPTVGNVDRAKTIIRELKSGEAEYLSDQRDVTHAIARVLTDLAPSAVRGAVPLKTIKKSDFKNLPEEALVKADFRGIAIVKDRDLFDIIEDGIYPAMKVRKEAPIIVFLRMDPLAISALAVQMDGEEFNLVHWACIPLGDEDTFLDAMSFEAQEAYYEGNPEFENYFARLIGLFDSSDISNDDEAPLQPAEQNEEAQQNTPPLHSQPHPVPVPDATPTIDIDQVVAEKMKPVLEKLAIAENQIAKMQSHDCAETLKTLEDERIATLQASIENDRREFAELLRVMENDRREFAELLRFTESEKKEAIAEALALRVALRAQSKSRVAAPPPRVFPSSLANLEPWANEHLLGRVYIMPRAYRTMRKVVFTDVERACKALLLLAGPYLDSKHGIEGANQKFLDGLKELRLIDKCQVAVGGGMRSSEFHISYHGERLFLDKHIRGKDSRYNDEKLLRIYYHYHEATDQVLIGHMPSHLTTEAS